MTSGFEPVVVATTLVALLAVIPPAIAIGQAGRLIVRARRGGALPPGRWRDAAAAGALGALGYAALGPAAAIAGLSVAFILWACREPAAATADM
jgi:hypothetical protein